MKVKFKGHAIIRDGQILGCQNTPDSRCGDWCPAFWYYPKPKNGTISAYVVLKCFPQEVIFEIEE